MHGVLATSGVRQLLRPYKDIERRHADATDMHARSAINETALVRKISWRIIPFVFVLYVVSYLDRANIGYAALQMNKAKWLKPEERDWLLAELENDKRARPDVKHMGTFKALASPKVLYLSFIYFVYQCGSLGVGYWMPQIIKGFSTELSHTQIGLIAMVPYLFATVVMVFWSRSSDRRSERRLHSAIPLAVAAASLCGAGIALNPYVSVLMISLSLAGLYAFKSPFWALPTLFLSRSSAAVSIAVINSIGNLGGFAGPFAISYIKGQGGSATTGLLFLSGLLAVSFLMTLLIRINDRAAAQAAPVPSNKSA